MRSWGEPRVLCGPLGMTDSMLSPCKLQEVWAGTGRGWQRKRCTCQRADEQELLDPSMKPSN